MGLHVYFIPVMFFALLSILRCSSMYFWTNAMWLLGYWFNDSSSIAIWMQIYNVVNFFLGSLYDRIPQHAGSSFFFSLYNNSSTVGSILSHGILTLSSFLMPWMGSVIVCSMRCPRTIRRTCYLLSTWQIKTKSALSYSDSRIHVLYRSVF